MKTLQSAVTRWTLLAALVGMLAYGAIEYVVTAPESLSGFISHHLLDVAVVMFAVWLASLVVIRKVVIEPVGRIFLHLRRMAAGRIEFIEGEMKSREIADVAGSINQLVSRLTARKDDRSAAEGLEALMRLRSELRDASDSLGERAVPVMKALSALEGTLLHLLPDLPEESAVCCRHGGSDCKPAGH